MSLAAACIDTYLAIHEDVKANPKHLEEVPVIGPILHEVPGKPWRRGDVGGEMTENYLELGVHIASGMQCPLEIYKDSPTSSIIV